MQHAQDISATSTIDGRIPSLQIESFGQVTPQVAETASKDLATPTLRPQPVEHEPRVSLIPDAAHAISEVPAASQHTPATPRTRQAREKLESLNRYLAQADGTQWDTIDEDDLALFDADAFPAPNICIEDDYRVPVSTHITTAIQSIKKNSTEISASSLFETARGNTIAVSEERMAKARSLLASTDNNATTAPQQAATTAFAGFQTARGSTIAVSEERMAQARSLLAEDHTVAQTEPVVTPVAHPPQTPAQTLARHSRPSSPAVTPSFKSPMMHADTAKLSRSVPSSTGARPPPSVPRFGSHFKPPARVAPVISLKSPSLSAAKVRQSIEEAAAVKPIERVPSRPVEKVVPAMLSTGIASGQRTKATTISLHQLREESAAMSPSKAQIPPSHLSVDSENASRFQFSGYHPNEIILAEGISVQANSKGCAGWVEIEEALSKQFPLPVPTRWVENHYRWIVWKLASTQRAFSNRLGVYLTLDRVLSDLCYRYDREINLCHRSIIRKAMEGDESLSRCVVLLVANIIFTPNLALEPALRNSSAKPEQEEAVTPTKRSVGRPAAVIELSDGWYSVKTQLDHELSTLLSKGKLFSGMKLIIWGAQLDMPSQTTPLEAGESVILRVFGNGTRPARWDTRLGLYQGPVAFKVPLYTVVPQGGLAPCVDVVVSRKYPVMFQEWLPDGSRVTRNERDEHAAANAWAQQRERFLASNSRKMDASTYSQSQDTQQSQMPLRISVAMCLRKIFWARLMAKKLTPCSDKLPIPMK